MRINIQKIIQLTQAYTNLVFSNEDKEDLLKLYDLLVSSGLWNEIYNNIPEDEKKYINAGVDETIASYYKYRNSILGILETINTDYQNLNLDAEQINEKLSNKEGVELLANVIDKLG